MIWRLGNGNTDEVSNFENEKIIAMENIQLTVLEEELKSKLVARGINAETRTINFWKRMFKQYVHDIRTNEEEFVLQNIVAARLLNSDIVIGK